MSSTSEIDFNAVPGTSHLVDIDNTENVKKKGKDIILIPTPSDDPNDPLNWSAKRKWTQIFCLSLYCFGSIPCCAIYSILTDISKDPKIKITVAQLNDGTGYFFLFLGLGGFIMLPLAQQYGKRPVYLFSMLALIGFNIWLPFLHSSGEWTASKILTGFFYAPVESLPQISITDMTFEHDRGIYIGVYTIALCASNYLAPIVAGFINDSLGWRYVIYIAVIFTAVCIIIMFFFMEETNYDRTLRVTKSSEGIVTAITSNGEEKNPCIISELKDNEIQDTKTCDNFANQTSVVEVDEPVVYPPIKNFWERLSLTSGIKKENHLVDYFMLPFLMARFPIVLYSGFLYGASLFFYSILNDTASLVLTAKPYNFSASIVGLTYISPSAFVFIIIPIAGWAVDWLKIHIARKHRGLSEAEDRLWILAFYSIVGPASLILWGVGAAHGIHWFGIIIGMGLMAGICAIGNISSITYTLDCYPQFGIDAMLIVILIRNVMNYAISFSITVFIENVGMQNTFIACAFICLGCIGSFVIMMLTGKYWRKRTAKMYWKMVEKYRAKHVIS